MANKDFNLNSFCLDDYLDFVDKGSKKKKKKKDKKDKKGKKKNKETKKYSKEHDLYIKSLYAPENLSGLVDIQKCPKEMLKEVSIAKQVIEASQANISEYVNTVFKAASEVIMDEYNKEKEEYLKNDKSEETSSKEEEVKEEKKEKEPKKEKKKQKDEKKKDKKKNSKHDNEEEGPMSILIR